MCDRFDIRRTPECTSTGFQPVRGGLFRLASLPEMVRQNLRGDVMPTFERCSEARMQLLPSGPKQGRISSVLQLAQGLGADRERFDAVWGLWMIHNTGDAPEAAREITS